MDFGSIYWGVLNLHHLNKCLNNQAVDLYWREYPQTIIAFPHFMLKHKVIIRNNHRSEICFHISQGDGPNYWAGK